MVTHWQVVVLISPILSLGVLVWYFLKIHYTTSELILLGYRSIFKKYHTKTPRYKIGEISTTTCQWVTIHLLDKTCEMNGMCRETVVRK